MLPMIGTWNQRDPFRIKRRNQSKLAYVGDSPTTWVDMYGLYQANPQWPTIPFQNIINPLLTFLLEELNRLKGICACELAVSGIPALIDQYVPLPQAPHGKPNWPWQHCTSNCLMVAACGGDEKAVKCAARLSLLKEILDVVACYLVDHQNGDSCDSAFQASDFDDNSAGRGYGTGCDTMIVIDQWPFFKQNEDSCPIDKLRCCVVFCASRNPIGKTAEGPGTGKPYGPFAAPGKNGEIRAGEWPRIDQVLNGIF